MNLRQLVEQRIKDSNLGFKEVAGSADLANVMKGRVSPPACYVITEGDKPGDNLLVSPGVVQSLKHDIGVIIVVHNVRDAQGADADDQSQDFRLSVRGSLLGWQPDAGYENMVYLGSRLVSFANAFLISKSTYRTEQFINA